MIRPWSIDILAGTTWVCVSPGPRGCWGRRDRGSRAQSCHPAPLSPATYQPLSMFSTGTTIVHRIEGQILMRLWKNLHCIIFAIFLITSDLNRSFSLGSYEAFSIICLIVKIIFKRSRPQRIKLILNVPILLSLLKLPNFETKICLQAQISVRSANQFSSNLKWKQN